MNLYLYRPPCSAQPKSILYGLIYGTLHRYYWQNTDPKWLTHYIAEFYKRLLDRGHTANNLHTLFQTAMTRVTQSTPPIPKTKQKQLKALDGTTFLHLQYHPQDPPRRAIQTLFQQRCRPALNDAYIPSGEDAGTPVTFGRLIVAYSRAPNIASLAQQNHLQPDVDTHIHTLGQPKV